MEKIASSLTDQVVISDCALDEAIAVGRQMEEQGVEVIISRRGTAFLLRESLNIPVVSLPQSSLDLINSLRKASRISKKILFPSFRNRITETKTLSDLFGIQLMQGIYHDRASLLDLIRKYHHKGAQVVLGGRATKEGAEKLGMHYIEIVTSTENINSALENARSVAESNRRQKAMAREYRCIIDAASDGMVAVNDKGVITAVNKTALKMISGMKQNCIGRPIDQYLPRPVIKKVLETKNAVYDRIESIGGERFVVSHIPVTMEGDIIGGICTFREISKVIRTENAIRRVLHKGLVARYVIEDLIHESRIMKEVVESARQFAKTDSTILVMGETGTGKEVLAQSVHNMSGRKPHPFVSVNCAALPEHLLESELFGYEEGAFTGSKKGGKPGHFELAHNGTIFLDEVDTAHNDVQIRLLRVLQEREVMRIGGAGKIPVNVRVIAAASKELEHAVARGRFREDLFFRLNVLRIMIPALRERKQDIPILLDHFIRRFSSQNQIEPLSLPADYVKKLTRYSWPGNVRQLRNFAERLVLTSHLKSSSPFMEKLYEELAQYAGPQSPPRVSPEKKPDLKDAFDRKKRLNESAFILEALESCRYSKSRAARILGISRTTLWRKMRALGLDNMEI